MERASEGKSRAPDMLQDQPHPSPVGRLSGPGGEQGLVGRLIITAVRVESRPGPAPVHKLGIPAARGRPVAASAPAALPPGRTEPPGAFQHGQLRPIPSWAGVPLPGISPSSPPSLSPSGTLPPSPSSPPSSSLPLSHSLAHPTPLSHSLYRSMQVPPLPRLK